MKNIPHLLLRVFFFAAVSQSTPAQTPAVPRDPHAAEYPAAHQAKALTRVVTWTMAATPEQVFPLLCPVREYDWIPWWRAEIVHSVSGVAEENCIFRTHTGPAAGLTWVCTRYEPNRQIEYTCFAPDQLIVRLKIVLTPIAAGTRMDWTRSWLSLGAAGDGVIEHWSAAAYEAMMARHEQEMAHYLHTGRLLPEARP